MKIHPATLEFLKAINQYNSRKYFATVKDLYKDIRKNLQDIATELIEETGKYHEGFDDIQAKDCLFRIYRDARRLKQGDNIYKQNFGMSIAIGGRKSQLPAYYFHIQPGNNSFFCGGIYRPDTTQLGNLRRYIAKHGDRYKNIINSQEIKKTFGNITGNKLKKTPRGFLEDEKWIDYIKMKQHMFIVNISDKQLLESDITTICKKYIQILDNRMSFLYVGLAYTKK